MVADDLAKLFTKVEVLWADFRSMRKELDYKHSETKKDIDVLHKRIDKLESMLTDRIDSLRQVLDRKYFNGNGNGNSVIASRNNGWSDKRRATVGGGIGIGVIIAIIELFNIYKGGA